VCFANLPYPHFYGAISAELHGLVSRCELDFVKSSALQHTSPAAAAEAVCQHKVTAF